MALSLKKVIVTSIIVLVLIYIPIATWHICAKVRYSFIYEWVFGVGLLLIAYIVIAFITMIGVGVGMLYSFVSKKIS
jgi:hypothetical protein